MRSVIHPRTKRIGIIEQGKRTTAQERQHVGVLAGAIAEELCEAYGDTLEPSAVARSAMEAYSELMADPRVFGMGDEPD